MLGEIGNLVVRFLEQPRMRKNWVMRRKGVMGSVSCVLDVLSSLAEGILKDWNSF